MRSLRLFCASFVVCVFTGLASGAGDEARLLRFPAIHGDQIVFSYAGDLYTAPSKGGVARRLTSDVGYEMFPRFSPDGRQLAFTAQYDGNTEVYLMPAEGGVPKRLTFTATLGRDDVSDRMGPNNVVMGWRDDGHVVYRSRRAALNDWLGQLYSVPVEGGMSVQLPLSRGAWCSFSPDGKKMAYNRVFREFRTWKRYRGGQADDIWIYDFASGQSTNITQNSAQDVFPMWHGNTVYFNSDRDAKKRFNLYACNLDTQETRQLTHFEDYDVKFPSLGDEAIVFENGGYIYRLDLKNDTAPEKVSIRIQEDLVSGRNKRLEVSKNISSFDVSPDGNRALFGARGDVFTVPAKYGNTRNLTATPGVHERDAQWSPDGRNIAYVSDSTGEDQIYIRPQDGSGEPVQLTQNGHVYKYHPEWSPNSRKILWSDREQKLHYVDVQTRQVTEVTRSDVWEITQYVWSPDSLWIAFVKPEVESHATLQLYSVASTLITPVTDGWFSISDPAFSADGKYLFFESRRSFDPVSSEVEFNYAYFDMGRIYFVTLAKDVKSPFEPKSDEVKIATASKSDAKNDAKPDAKTTGESGKDEKKDIKKEDKAGVTVKVDLEGIIERIAALPTGGSDYSGITALENKVYYMRHGRKEEKTKLLFYDLEKQKETELGEVNGYVISADHKKMLVNADGAYAIMDTPTGRIEMKDKLNLSEMKIQLDRQAEWHQIFAECWRQMRDFLFDPHMRGVDWAAMRARYEPLVSSVQHRADLTYIIGEMIGELNIGHTYVGGGDYPKPERIKTGLLGAQIVKDPASKYFRIVKILKGQNWEPGVRSPLTEIGVEAAEGDYITAVNGVPTDRMANIYEALVDKVGRQVRLQINSKPSSEGGHETVVLPIGDEHPLYYYTWVRENIAKVTKASHGKIGYIHIPDMGVEGMNEFVKYYYPQLRREGLIVDVRGNGGGNVSPQIIERLHRELAMITIARNSIPHANPDDMQYGPKACLLDEFSASDGDIFPYRFRTYKMGPLIGKRSWGGVVGIRGSLPLLDGGFLNKPEFSRYDIEGREWIMEGHGVDPDIVVENDPAREFEGIDAQLDRAVQVVLEQIQVHPPRLAPPPPYPDKSH